LIGASSDSKLDARWAQLSNVAIDRLSNIDLSYSTVQGTVTAIDSTWARYSTIVLGNCANGVSCSITKSNFSNSVVTLPLQFAATQTCLAQTNFTESTVSQDYSQVLDTVDLSGAVINKLHWTTVSNSSFANAMFVGTDFGGNSFTNSYFGAAQNVGAAAPLTVDGGQYPWGTNKYSGIPLNTDNPYNNYPDVQTDAGWFAINVCGS
jgi:uncharacterized protein YjbI with pentapeptide repeats